MIILYAVPISIWAKKTSFYYTRHSNNIFLFRVRGDMRARPRYADADSAKLRVISADRKQKSFEMVKKIHMQNFSLLTSEIPELEQFKDWNLDRVSQSELLNAFKIVIAYVRRLKFCMWIFFYISKLFCLLSATYVLLENFCPGFYCRRKYYNFFRPKTTLSCFILLKRYPC